MVATNLWNLSGEIRMRDEIAGVLTVGLWLVVILLWWVIV
jgi:hypothetical protein